MHALAEDRVHMCVAAAARVIPLALSLVSQVRGLAQVFPLPQGFVTFPRFRHPQVGVRLRSPLSLSHQPNPSRELPRGGGVVVVLLLSLLPWR